MIIRLSSVLYDFNQISVQDEGNHSLPLVPLVDCLRTGNFSLECKYNPVAFSTILIIVSLWTRESILTWYLIYSLGEQQQCENKHKIKRFELELDLPILVSKPIITCFLFRAFRLSTGSHSSPVF